MSQGSREMRERAIYPILIPLAAIVVTEVVVFSMSQVLLVTGGQQATAIALAAAIGILLGSALVAARPRMTSGAIFGLLGLVAVVTIGAGAYALTQEPFYEKEAEASRPKIEVGAVDLVFDTDTLELASSGTVIDFTNDDSQPHNISVYPSAEERNDALFKGEIIAGGESITYEVGEIEPGEYYFHCDVHPNMNGDAIVQEAAASEAH